MKRMSTRQSHLKKAEIADWLKTDANRKTLDGKFEKFVISFKSGINKVYSKWET